MRKFLFVLFLLAFASTASAQGKKDDKGSGAPNEFGFFSGPYLISNAAQSLPSIGARFSLGVVGSSFIELQGFGANSGGVSYYMGELGWRSNFKINKMLTGFSLIAFDYHYFRSRTATEYAADYGLHLGSGVLFNISDTVSFRGDFGFKAGAFRALMVTAGITWVLGGGED